MLKEITPPSMPMLIEDLGIRTIAEGSKYKKRYGLYKCSCGNDFVALTPSIKSGNTKSCGCHNLNVLRSRKNNYIPKEAHRLYAVWSAMKNRCSNKKNKNFCSYGGRGITVCDRWMNINNFIEDMLPAWSVGLQLDRINNDGNYEPSNCRWVARNIQNRNTRMIYKSNTSGYRGVSWNKSSNKWVSKIKIDGKQKSIGYFNSPIEAAKVYDQYVIDNNLEHTINGVLSC